jgi:hypothetical protein
MPLLLRILWDLAIFPSQEQASMISEKSWEDIISQYLTDEKYVQPLNFGKGNCPSFRINISFLHTCCSSISLFKDSGLLA